MLPLMMKKILMTLAMPLALVVVTFLVLQN